MNKLKFLIPLAVFLVLAVFLGLGLNLNPREVPSPLIDKPAPGFALASLHEPTQTIKREDLLGKVWILNVWASWCVACRQEHPLLVEYAKKPGFVPIYGLNYKDRRDDGLAWLRQMGDPYVASLFDFNGKVGIDYGVYGVPETFVIDKAGTIRYKHIGPLTPEVMVKSIEPLLAKLNGNDPT